MAEIYRDSTPTIALGLNTATAVSATITRDGTTVATPAIQSGNAIIVPFSVTGFNGPFTINWAFTYSGVTTTRSETHEVVTPYVTVTDIRAALTIPSDVTDAQLIRLERRCRKIIEQICGQEFGMYPDTKSILGRGDKYLELPARLISFSSITGSNVINPVSAYETRGDGFQLALSPDFTLDDVIYDTSGDQIIVAPPLDPILPKWRDGYRYTITGVWGYEEVPANISEAVLVLIEQAICPDSTYRDRYIEDVTYADTSFSFTGDAFRGTGNAVADSLIAEYVRFKITVI